MNISIPTVFCFDANYAPYAAVSTLSAILNNSDTPMKFLWVTYEKDKSIALTFKEKLMMHTDSIEILAVSDNQFDGWYENAHISKAAYLRVMIPNLINDDSALYLDCDTITKSSLTDLLSINLGDHMVAGVRDPVGESSSRIPRSCEDTYINSGVLLMNLKILRRENFFEKICKASNEFHDKATWLDQCLINKITEGRKLIVDEKWNRQIFANQTTAQSWADISSSEDTSIIHFLGSTKPWSDWCNKEVSDYWWSISHNIEKKLIHNQRITKPEQAMELFNYLNGCQSRAGKPSKINKVINKFMKILTISRT